MDIIDKICTSNQPASTSSLCPRQGKKLSSRLGLVRLLEISTYMALVSIIVATHNITLTIRNEVPYLPTLVTLFLNTRTLIGTTTYRTTPITLDRSRSSSPTWFLLNCISICQQESHTTFLETVSSLSFH